MIGELSPEQSAKLQEAIAEKSKLAAGLRATWKEKFEAFKVLKTGMEQERATMERLKIAGKLNLTDAQIQEGNRDNLEKTEAAGREAENYLNDAKELEAEVEELQAKLENRGN